MRSVAISATNAEHAWRRSASFKDTGFDVNRLRTPAALCIGTRIVRCFAAFRSAIGRRHIFAATPGAKASGVSRQPRAVSSPGNQPPNRHRENPKKRRQAVGLGRGCVASRPVRYGQPARHLASAFLVIADVGGVRLRVGAEVAEADEWARARVLDDDAGSRLLWALTKTSSSVIWP